MTQKKVIFEPSHTNVLSYDPQEKINPPSLQSLSSATRSRSVSRTSAHTKDSMPDDNHPPIPFSARQEGSGTPDFQIALLKRRESLKLSSYISPNTTRPRAETYQPGSVSPEKQRIIITTRSRANTHDSPVKAIPQYQSLVEIVNVKPREKLFPKIKSKPKLKASKSLTGSALLGNDVTLKRSLQASPIKQLTEGIEVIPEEDRRSGLTHSVSVGDLRRKSPERMREQNKDSNEKQSGDVLALNQMQDQWNSLIQISKNMLHRDTQRIINAVDKRKKELDQIHEKHFKGKMRWEMIALGKPAKVDSSKMYTFTKGGFDYFKKKVKTLNREI